MSNLSAALLAAYSNGMECPNCHLRLEVGTFSRYLGAWGGMAAGWLAWRLTRGGEGILGGALPLLYAVLAFGIVSAALVMLIADLRPAPETAAESAPPAHGHGAHGGHH